MKTNMKESQNLLGMSKYTAYARKKYPIQFWYLQMPKKHPTYFQIIWLWNLTNEKSKEKNPKHKSFPL